MAYYKYEFLVLEVQVNPGGTSNFIIHFETLDGLLYTNIKFKKPDVSSISKVTNDTSTLNEEPSN